MKSHSKYMYKLIAIHKFITIYLETGDPLQAYLGSLHHQMAYSNGHVITSFEWTTGEQKTLVDLPAWRDLVFIY